MVNMPLAPGRVTPPYPAESLTPRFGFTEYPEMCMPYPATYPSHAEAYELEGMHAYMFPHRDEGAKHAFLWPSRPDRSVLPQTSIGIQSRGVNTIGL